jgi:arabinose-5-phosphate isomerase
LRTVAAERAGLDGLAGALSAELGVSFRRAVETILRAKGRVIVAGIGKSGHVARKIAATLASTGTPAYFVHAAEASHGDLGMIAPDDVVLALSWSGETAELGALIDYTARFGVTLVAVTADVQSSLARAADLVLLLPRVGEACPNGLAPTTSSTTQLVLGDALAVALLEARGFSARDFRVFHPGGRLGAQLRLVRDLMHAGDALPLAPSGTTIEAAIAIMSQKGFGCVAVVDHDGRLTGIVTDGDVRRAFGRQLTSGPVERIMTKTPRTIAPDALAADAVAAMNTGRITVLIVVEQERVVGLLHMHDLLRAAVV